MERTIATERDRRIRDDMARGMNLMAHPMAALAAANALSIGMASHVAGLWFGTMAGGLEAARRLSGTLPFPAGATGLHEPAYKGPSSPAIRTRAAVDSLLAEAESGARELVRATRSVAAGAAAWAEPASDRQPASPGTAAGIRAPQRIERPAAPDDLKAISGIGPKLETVLNGLGVWTYDQIADWGREEIAWVDDYLSFSGRIDRDDWIGQAKKLARG